MTTFYMNKYHERFFEFISKVAPFSSGTQINWLFEQLSFLYSDRPYHNLDHVSYCLSQLDVVEGTVKNRDSLEFSLWYHDCHYHPGSKSNERDSSNMAFFAGRDLSLNDKFIKKVQRLILSTSKHRSLRRIVRTDRDEDTLHDIDYSILGQQFGDYERYSQGVQRELIGTGLYPRGRVYFLREILKRNIFRTDYFFHMYEDKARANIEWELELLVSRYRG